MKDRHVYLAALRSDLEKSTAAVLVCVRRNEFIGKPVTTLEREIRERRDREIQFQLKKAREALTQFEKAAQEVEA